MTDPLVVGATPPERTAQNEAQRAQIDDFGPYLSQKDLSEVLGVSAALVRNWLKRGKLPEVDYRIGGRPAWSRKHVKQFCRDLEVLDAGP